MVQCRFTDDYSLTDSDNGLVGKILIATWSESEDTSSQRRCFVHSPLDNCADPSPTQWTGTSIQLGTRNKYMQLVDTSRKPSFLSHTQRGSPTLMTWSLESVHEVLLCSQSAWHEAILGSWVSLPGENLATTMLIHQETTQRDLYWSSPRDGSQELVRRDIRNFRRPVPRT